MPSSEQGYTVFHDEARRVPIQIAQGNRHHRTPLANGPQGLLPVHAVEGVAGVDEQDQVGVFGRPELLQCLGRSFAAAGGSGAQLNRSAGGDQVILADFRDGLSNQPPEGLPNSNGAGSTILLAQSDQATLNQRGEGDPPPLCA